MRVLVVEDSFDSRCIWVRLLRSYGHEAKGVDTLETAIPLCGWAEACLLDLMLPDGPGASLIQFLPKGRVAVTSASSWWEQKLRDAGHDPKSIASFPKPINPSKVIQWLDGLTDCTTSTKSMVMETA
jgi:DNA-binding response OmpR family regulator